MHPLSATGDKQFAEHQYSVAILTYNQLIKDYPANKAGYFNRALCLYYTENYAQAIYDFEESLSLDSFYTKAAVAKAFSLEKKGDLKAAVACYTLLSTEIKNNYGLQKRIQNYKIAVSVSKNWYYMLSMLLVVVILLAVVAKSFAKRV